MVSTVHSEAPAYNGVGVEGVWQFHRRGLPSAYVSARNDAFARGCRQILVIATYLLLLPGQVAVKIGGAAVFPYRLVLAMGLVWVLAHAGRGRMKLGIVEYLMIGLCFWAFCAVGMVAGSGKMVTAGSTMLFDAGASYFLARYAFPTVRDVQRYLVIVIPGYFAAALTLPMETLAGQYIVQPLAQKLFPSDRTFVTQEALVRFGLLRAAGPWPHPILAGMQLASLLPFMIVARLHGWPRQAGFAASLLSVFTISSSNLLSLAAQAGLLFFDKMTKRVRGLSWRLGLTCFAVLLAVLQVSTSSGAVGFLMRFGALNAGSAGYRGLIWRYGTQSVANHPFFGVAYGEWDRLSWMPGTIDNYWLNLAVQLGFPAVILGLGAPIATVVMLGRAMGRARGLQRSLCLASSISITVFTLGAFSVSLWAQAQVWFSILLGIGVALATQQPGIRGDRRRAMPPLQGQ